MDMIGKAVVVSGGAFVAFVLAVMVSAGLGVQDNLWLACLGGNASGFALATGIEYFRKKV